MGSSTVASIIEHGAQFYCPCCGKQNKLSVDSEKKSYLTFPIAGFSECMGCGSGLFFAIQSTNGEYEIMVTTKNQVDSIEDYIATGIFD